MRSSREWFLSRGGQVEGPLSSADIRERLAQGELTPLDQICQAGEASDLQWKLIFECAEFTERFSAKRFTAGADAVTADGPAEWVLLRQTTTGDFSLKRAGPYTAEDLAVLLREGSIHFTDYVWKKGFQRWAQLETLREFNYALASPPRLELVGAVGIDTETPVAVPPLVPLQKPMEIPALSARPDSASAPVWMRAAIAFVISLGVMLALASIRPWKKVHSQSAGRGITRLDAGGAAGTDAYLRILPLDMEVHPKLEFEMSAPPKTFLQVSLKGREGEILHRMRFEQTVTLQKRGNEEPVLDLSPLGLPEGTYEVRVSDGQLRTEQQIFVGARTASFDRALAVHRAEIAHQRRVENRAVYDYADQLAGMVDRLPAQGTFAKNGWSGRYSKWVDEFEHLPRLDRAEEQSADPELLRLAQGLARTIRQQASAINAAVNSSTVPSGATTASVGYPVPIGELKKQILQLQAEAAGRRGRSREGL